jgi:hypothetical protein
VWFEELVVISDEVEMRVPWAAVALNIDGGAGQEGLSELTKVGLPKDSVGMGIILGNELEDCGEE